MHLVGCLNRCTGNARSDKYQALKLFENKGACKQSIFRRFSINKLEPWLREIYGNEVGKWSKI